MPLQVRIHFTDQPSKLAYLLEGRAYVLGRGSDTDVQIHHPAVSRRHARLAFQDGQWRFEDLNSSSGSYCESQQIDRYDLAGDVTSIRVGNIWCEMAQVPYRDAVANESYRHWQREQVLQASRELAQPMDLERVARLATETLQNLFPQERAALLLVDGDGQVIAYDHPFEWMRSEEFLGSRTAIRRAVSTREAVVLAHVATDTQLASAESVVTAGIQSLMCVPVAFKDEVFAVLYADSHQVRKPFTELDVGLVRAYARQLGIIFKLQQIEQKLAKSQ